MPKKLSKKEDGFIRDYLETGNGTQSALKNYDTTDENVAANIAWENLRKPKIIARLQEASSIATETIIQLAQSAENENVRLGASKDILDRGGFKPVEKSVNIDVNVDITDPKARELANEYEEKLKGNL